MNADDRAPFGESQQPFAPTQGEAGVRRSGIMPTSNSVPQRTAFRPVTGTQTTGSQGAAARPDGAQPPSAPQPTQNRPAPERSGQPTTQASGVQTTRPVSSPATGVPATGAPATSGAAGAGASGLASGETETRSATAAAGVARLKSIRNKAATTVSEADVAAAKAIGPRKVRVLISRLDPWSALKIGFLLSIALGIMFIIAVHILWSALNSMGTIDLVNDWVQRLFTTEQEVNILQFLNYGKVMSAALLVAVTNVVLISGLSVIGAMLYNTVSRVVGGVYVTLTDD